MDTATQVQIMDEATFFTFHIALIPLKWKEWLTAESKTGKNMFCMWRKETFLRVRVRFVECRDALMQILASLDRDKNNSVGIAGVLLLQREESEKWHTVGLCFVKKITNRACEWGEIYSLICFIFFYLMIIWTCQGKRQTDSTSASEISTCDKKEASLKNFCFNPWEGYESNYSLSSYG